MNFDCISGGMCSWSALISETDTLSVPANSVTPKMSRNGTACAKNRARFIPSQRIRPNENRPSMQVTITASANQTG